MTSHIGFSNLVLIRNLNTLIDEAEGLLLKADPENHDTRQRLKTLSENILNAPIREWVKENKNIHNLGSLDETAVDIVDKIQSFMENYRSPSNNGATELKPLK